MTKNHRHVTQPPKMGGRACRSACTLHQHHLLERYGLVSQSSRHNVHIGHRFNHSKGPCLGGDIVAQSLRSIQHMLRDCACKTGKGKNLSGALGRALLDSLELDSREYVGESYYEHVGMIYVRNVYAIDWCSLQNCDKYCSVRSGIDTHLLNTILHFATKFAL